MIPLKALVLCSLIFILGCLSIPSKAHDETYWPSDVGVFLRNGQRTNQKRAISDTEISATALKIWNSEKDFNVQYDGVTHKKEPLSSGFEHAFLGEINNRAVSGLHNWMRMYDEELEGRFKLTVDAKYFPTEKPAVDDVRFTWNGLQKIPGSSFFMKKSPAVEMALYTLCFMVRPGQNCPIDLGSFQLNVATFAWAAKTDLIGTAYPIIP